MAILHFHSRSGDTTLTVTDTQARLTYHTAEKDTPQQRFAIPDPTHYFAVVGMLHRMVDHHDNPGMLFSACSHNFPGLGPVIHDH